MIKCHFEFLYPFTIWSQKFKRVDWDLIMSYQLVFFTLTILYETNYYNYYSVQGLTIYTNMNIFQYNWFQPYYSSLHDRYQITTCNRWKSFRFESFWLMKHPIWRVLLGESPFSELHKRFRQLEVKHTLEILADKSWVESQIDRPSKHSCNWQFIG